MSQFHSKLLPMSTLMGLVVVFATPEISLLSSNIANAQDEETTPKETPPPPEALVSPEFPGTCYELCLTLYVFADETGKPYKCIHDFESTNVAVLKRIFEEVNFLFAQHHIKFHATFKTLDPATVKLDDTDSPHSPQMLDKVLDSKGQLVVGPPDPEDSKNSGKRPLGLGAVGWTARNLVKALSNWVAKSTCPCKIRSGNHCGDISKKKIACITGFLFPDIVTSDDQNIVSPLKGLGESPGSVFFSTMCIIGCGGSVGRAPAHEIGHNLGAAHKGTTDVMSSPAYVPGDAIERENDLRSPIFDVQGMVEIAKQRVEGFAGWYAGCDRFWNSVDRWYGPLTRWTTDVLKRHEQIVKDAKNNIKSYQDEIARLSAGGISPAEQAQIDDYEKKIEGEQKIIDNDPAALEKDLTELYSPTTP